MSPYYNVFLRTAESIWEVKSHLEKILNCELKADDNRKVKSNGEAEVVALDEFVDPILEENADFQLEILVLCGRMTVCLSLLKFLVEDKGVLPDDENDPYHNNYQKIKTEWMKFKNTYKY